MCLCNYYVQVLQLALLRQTFFLSDDLYMDNAHEEMNYDFDDGDQTNENVYNNNV